nr:MAG TPA: hypothetical protein [Caudoviricetes sp.]
MTPLYQKNGYKCRKARLLPGLCLQSDEGRKALIVTGGRHDKTPFEHRH